jgi:hypothetical protein
MTVASTPSTMTTPTVTEITRTLEPVARDTFVDSPAPGATLLTWPSGRRASGAPRNTQGRGSRPSGSPAHPLSAAPAGSERPIVRPRAA